MLAKDQVVALVNWDVVMQQERCAGGHEEVMHNIFFGNADVISFHVDNDYEGELAFAYKFHDGTIAILTDYFGSCGGCDQWEDSTDKEATLLIKALASNARLFASEEEAKEFCRHVTDDACDYGFRVAANLFR